ncbi:MAG: DUF433 domain-containing protein [Planctomycetes bacterium]|nr:DUF433 domain-containing protein [Planctomycetota bacterium]
MSHSMTSRSTWSEIFGRCAQLALVPGRVGLIASGATIAEILADYPYLEAEDIEAVMRYAELGENRESS